MCGEVKTPHLATQPGGVFVVWKGTKHNKECWLPFQVILREQCEFDCHSESIIGLTRLKQDGELPTSTLGVFSLLSSTDCSGG
jgi:hypothetical protein